jgi:hypothetical protein
MIVTQIESTDVCAVCGCATFRVDEVVDGAVLRLTECSRCAHRWTARPEWETPRSFPSSAGASTRAETGVICTP